MNRTTPSQFASVFDRIYLRCLEIQLGHPNTDPRSAVEVSLEAATAGVYRSRQIELDFEATDENAEQLQALKTEAQAAGVKRRLRITRPDGADPTAQTP